MTAQFLRTRWGTGNMTNNGWSTIVCWDVANTTRENWQNPGCWICGGRHARDVGACARLWLGAEWPAAICRWYAKLLRNFVPKTKTQQTHALEPGSHTHGRTHSHAPQTGAHTHVYSVASARPPATPTTYLYERTLVARTHTYTHTLTNGSLERKIPESRLGTLGNNNIERRTLIRTVS